MSSNANGGGDNELESGNAGIPQARQGENQPRRARRNDGARSAEIGSRILPMYDKSDKVVVAVVIAQGKKT